MTSKLDRNQSNCSVVIILNFVSIISEKYNLRVEFIRFKSLFRFIYNVCANHFTLR